MRQGHLAALGAATPHWSRRCLSAPGRQAAAIPCYLMVAGSLQQQGLLQCLGSMLCGVSSVYKEAARRNHRHACKTCHGYLLPATVIPHSAICMQARSARSRRGRPKSSDRTSRPKVVPDGADGDGEAAPQGATKAPAGRSLPGRKPTGICAWNPFAGLGPKLMVSFVSSMIVLAGMLLAYVSSSDVHCSASLVDTFQA